MCNLLEVGPTLEQTGGFNGVGRNVFGEQGVRPLIRSRIQGNDMRTQRKKPI